MNFVLSWVEHEKSFITSESGARCWVQEKWYKIMYMPSNYSCFCCSLLTFLKIYFFQKFFQEHYQNQTVWIQISTDILMVLIWVQNCFQRLSADNKICPLNLLTSTCNALPMDTNKKRRTVIAFVGDRKCLVLKLMHLSRRWQLRWHWRAPRPLTFHPRLFVFLLWWETVLRRMHWTSTHGSIRCVWKLEVGPRICPRVGTR